MTLRHALKEQAWACGGLGSPFMERLCNLAAIHLDNTSAVARRLLSWPGDVGPSAGSVPLRFAGGLHALKLKGYEPLVATYPPDPTTDSNLWAAVELAMAEHEGFLNDWLDSPPQTNEVRRSAALLAGAALVSRLTKLPLNLIELGASAGLNLNFDRFAVETPTGKLGAQDPVLGLHPEWSGDPPTLADIEVRDRSGCDISPIDPKSEQGRLRLLAYLWADQPDRLALTDAAINVANTDIQTADVVAFLKSSLTPSPGATRFVYHTVAWQYFTINTQSKAQRLIEAAGEQATRDTPLAWFSMETGQIRNGAQLGLRLWPGDHSFDLGSADFHGRWINWNEPGISPL